jgi:hypothetical protein
MAENPTQHAESEAPSTLARAILRMTKREKEAFALGVLAATESIPDSTITKMALARIDGTGAANDS